MQQSTRYDGILAFDDNVVLSTKSKMKDKMISKRNSKIEKSIKMSFLKNKSIKPNLLKPGFFVRVNNPKYLKDVAQIIDVNNKSGKVLLKMIPRINYRDIRSFKIRTQSALNCIIGPNATVPLNFFESELFITDQKRVKLKISWVKDGSIDAIQWDGDKYVGKFLYKKFTFSEIFPSKIQSKKICLFKSNLADFEQNDENFMANLEHFMKRNKVSKDVGLDFSSSDFEFSSSDYEYDNELTENELAAFESSEKDVDEGENSRSKAKSKKDESETKNRSKTSSNSKDEKALHHSHKTRSEESSRAQQQKESKSSTHSHSKLQKSQSVADPKNILLSSHKTKNDNVFDDENSSSKISQSKSKQKLPIKARSEPVNDLKAIKHKNKASSKDSPAEETLQSSSSKHRAENEKIASKNDANERLSVVSNDVNIERSQSQVASMILPPERSSMSQQSNVPNFLISSAQLNPNISEIGEERSRTQMNPNVSPSEMKSFSQYDDSNHEKVQSKSENEPNSKKGKSRFNSEDLIKSLKKLFPDSVINSSSSSSSSINRDQKVNSLPMQATATEMSQNVAKDEPTDQNTSPSENAKVSESIDEVESDTSKADQKIARSQSSAAPQVINNYLPSSRERRREFDYRDVRDFRESGRNFDFRDREKFFDKRRPFYPEREIDWERRFDRDPRIRSIDRDRRYFDDFERDRSFERGREFERLPERGFRREFEEGRYFDRDRDFERGRIRDFDRDGGFDRGREFGREGMFGRNFNENRDFDRERDYNRHFDFDVGRSRDYNRDYGRSREFDRAFDRGKVLNRYDRSENERNFLRERNFNKDFNRDGVKELKDREYNQRFDEGNEHDKKDGREKESFIDNDKEFSQKDERNKEFGEIADRNQELNQNNDRDKKISKDADNDKNESWKIKRKKKN